MPPKRATEENETKGPSRVRASECALKCCQTAHDHAFSSKPRLATDWEIENTTRRRRAKAHGRRRFSAAPIRERPPGGAIPQANKYYTSLRSVIPHKDAKPNMKRNGPMNATRGKRLGPKWLQDTLKQLFLRRPLIPTRGWVAPPQLNILDW